MTETRDVRMRQLMRFCCLDCGYGAGREQARERCPICSGSAWAGESERWPTTRSPHGTGDRRVRLACRRCDAYAAIEGD